MEVEVADVVNDWANVKVVRDKNAKSIAMKESVCAISRKYLIV